MLRLRIDLTACGAEFKDVFWRLERNGIFHKTVSQYATQLLQEYGVRDARPRTFLDGTVLPETESPLILRDGDLLRIVPTEVDSIRLVPSYKQVPEKLTHVVANGTITIQSSEDVAGNEVVANGQSRQNGTTATETVTADGSENLEGSDLSEPKGHASKKRKRGRRLSRTRSKRVSFDVVDDAADGDDIGTQMESTPFRKRASNDTIVKLSNDTSGDTRSEAYVTALEGTPGISNQSRRLMKPASVRKNKKLQSGVGYYLNLLGSGDSSLIAGSSSGDGLTSPANGHLDPGSSACGDGQRDIEGSREKSDQAGSSASADQSVILSELAPKDRVSCDIGMFNHGTSAVERYPNVTLEVLQNSNEKRSLTVKHIDGDLPDSVSGTDFKVDWGMLSSMRFS